MERLLVHTTCLAALVGLALATQGCTNKRRTTYAATAAATDSGATATTGSGTIGGVTSGTTGAVGTNAGAVAGGPGAVVPGAPPAAPTPTASGIFTDASLRLPNSNRTDWTVASGDVDGNGTPDLVVGTYAGTARVLLNTNGLFQEAPGRIPPVTMRATDLHLVDVDNDADLDVVVACNFEPVRVFKNDGAGSFSLSGQFPASNPCFTYKVAVGDLNNDGYVDLFMANAGQSTSTRGQNVLLLNDTQGGFALAPAGTVPAINDDSIGAVSLDVNNDGAQDVFVANFGTPHRMLVNDGNGRLLDQSDFYLPAALRTYGTCALALDFNKDGRIDIFLGNEGAPANGRPPAGEANTLLMQGASGRFSIATGRLPTHAEATFNARVVDVNADGWPDLAVSNLRAVQRLYINNQGTYVDATNNLPVTNSPTSESLGLAVGDFNADSAPDLIFVRRGRKPLLFTNLVASAPSPAAAAAGGGGGRNLVK